MHIIVMKEKTMALGPGFSTFSALLPQARTLWSIYLFISSLWKTGDFLGFHILKFKMKGLG